MQSLRTLGIVVVSLIAASAVAGNSGKPANVATTDGNMTLRGARYLNEAMFSTYGGLPAVEMLSQPCQQVSSSLEGLAGALSGNSSDHSSQIVTIGENI